MSLDTTKLLTSLQNGTLTLKVLLREMAPAYALSGKSNISDLKASCAHFIKEHPVFLKMQLQDVSNQLRRLDRDQIKNFLRKHLTSSDSTSQTRDPGAVYADVSEDEYASIVRATRMGLSESVADFLNLIQQATPDTVDAQARAFFNMSAADKRTHNKARRDNLPIDIIADTLYQMAQKATPENLRAALNALQANPETEKRFDDFFVHLARFTTDLIEAAARNNSLIPADTTAGLELASDMKFLMTAAEQALETAGITPDTPLLPQMKMHYALNRAIRLIHIGGDKPLPLPKMNR